MKVKEKSSKAPKKGVSADNIPVGMFAKIFEPVEKSLVVHLRLQRGLVRFINDVPPAYFALDTYSSSEFEVMPEGYSITLGGE